MITDGLVDTLRDYERTLKDARKRNKVVAVHLVMEVYKGIDIANLLNLHRQPVSKYVQNFNEGGIDQVIERRYAPGKTPYLTPEEEQTLKQMILESTPVQEELGMESYWDSRYASSDGVMLHAPNLYIAKS
ncbi:helix-turn-helix domain-containing protein [Bacillus taeanensis]|uniref:helix-turn-helix domain-containing protein n=1 Tax=Bacillus taeanensis TaxID=273032 RepID=UPI001FEADA25|nr:helix-turn-helix domain-containing protein [Bacillus taeanensis]